jgi:hypothetical protein
MRSSILGIYHSGGVFHPSATNIGQFGRLTDRTETLVPEPAEGALPKQYIYTVAYASGSERYFFLPCPCFCLFREIPWQMLLLTLSTFKLK